MSSDFLSPFLVLLQLLHPPGPHRNTNCSTLHRAACGSNSPLKVSGQTAASVATWETFGKPPTVCFGTICSNTSRASSVILTWIASCAKPRASYTQNHPLPHLHPPRALLHQTRVHLSKLRYQVSAVHHDHPGHERGRGCLSTVG